jgi:ubiquinone/menaquinone biosynthesis C-methylase UbiE
VNEGDPYEQIASFYDLAIDDFAADVDMYEALARRIDAPVLDVGTGTGRIAIELARRGQRVTGIDRAPSMLAIARRKAAESSCSTIEFHQADMRSPGIDGKFGLILCGLDTFLHLSSSEEQLAALGAWSSLLAPDGLIAIDLPGPAGEWSDWDPGARPLVLDWVRPQHGALVSRLSSYRADFAEQLRYVTDIFEETRADGTLRRHIVEYALRFVFPAEMSLLFRLAGLSPCGRYGDYELNAFDRHSERMIVLARLLRPGSGSPVRIV